MDVVKPGKICFFRMDLGVPILVENFPRTLVIHSVDQCCGGTMDSPYTMFEQWAFAITMDQKVIMVWKNYVGV